MPHQGQTIRPPCYLAGGSEGLSGSPLPRQTQASLAAVQPLMGQRKRRQRIQHNEGLQSPEKRAKTKERLQEERWSKGTGVGK